MTAKRSKQQLATRQRAPHLLWTGAFLHVFRQTGNVRQAAEAAGIDRAAVYKAAERWPWFKQEWEEAKQDAADLLIQEMRRRAIDGDVVDVKFIKGHPLVVRKYSDRLLELLVKAYRPEEFRESIEVVSISAVEKAIQRLNQELETMDDDGDTPREGIQTSETPRAEGATIREGPAERPKRS